MLTDWRAKRLLEKLGSRGRGYGRGKVFFSTQSDVLKRAILIFDLFATNQPTDAVMLDIWLYGFDVPANRIKAAWQRLWTAKLETPIRARREGSARDDLIVHYTDQVSRNVRWATGLNGRELDRAISAITMLMVDERYEFDEDDKQAIKVVFRNLLKDERLLGGQLVTMDGFDPIPLIMELRRWQSIQGVRRLIVSASYDDLRYARDVWLKGWRFFSRFVPRSHRKVPGTNLTWEQHWRIVAGRNAIPIILGLITKGHRTRIDRTIAAIETRFVNYELSKEAMAFLSNLIPNPELRAPIGVVMGIWDVGDSASIAKRS